MRTSVRCFAVFLLAFPLQAVSSFVFAQSNSGTITGTITDPSGAVVPGATVTINNPVSQYSRTATTDDAGHFNFANLPFNPYHLTANHSGFASFVRDIDVRSTVPENVNIKLAVGTESTTVTVEGGEDLVENDPTFHTDIDRGLFQKVPLESQSSVAQFAGHTGLARRCRRFQRPLPRPRRSRVEFLLDRRPADHRSAEQGLLQPDSLQLHPVAWK